jgi:hypothetical protein
MWGRGERKESQKLRTPMLKERFEGNDPDKKKQGITGCGERFATGESYSR